MDIRKLLAERYEAATINYDFSGLTTTGRVTTNEFRNQASRAIVVAQLVGAAWLGAASGVSIAGTPLVDFGDPSPPATIGNTLISTRLLSVNMQVGDNFRLAERAINWANILGNAQRPFILSSAIIIDPNQVTRWEVLGNLPAGPSVSGQITAHGFFVPIELVEEARRAAQAAGR
jgi:hypothetical protein